MVTYKIPTAKSRDNPTFCPREMRKPQISRCGNARTMISDSRLMTPDAFMCIGIWMGQCPPTYNGFQSFRAGYIGKSLPCPNSVEQNVGPDQSVRDPKHGVALAHWDEYAKPVQDSCLQQHDDKAIADRSDMGILETVRIQYVKTSIVHTYRR